jgi:hypothetical protein
MLDLQVEATYEEFFYVGNLSCCFKKNRMLDVRVEARCGELASQKTAGLFSDPQVRRDLRVEATYAELAWQTSDGLMDLGAGPASADLGAGPAGGGRSSILHGQLASQTSASTLWVLAQRRRSRDDHALALLESRMQAVSGQLSLSTPLLSSS